MLYWTAFTVTWNEIWLLYVIPIFESLTLFTSLFCHSNSIFKLSNLVKSSSDCISVSGFLLLIVVTPVEASVEKSTDFPVSISTSDIFNTISEDETPVTEGSPKNNSGLSISEYTKVDNYISGLEADKDSSGKSIQGSVKKKAISYLREQGYSDSTIKSIVEGYGWKFKEGD